jgi:hypothetical protein
VGVIFDVCISAVDRRGKIQTNKRRLPLDTRPASDAERREREAGEQLDLVENRLMHDRCIAGNKAGDAQQHEAAGEACTANTSPTYTKRNETLISRILHLLNIVRRRRGASTPALWHLTTCCATEVGWLPRRLQRPLRGKRGYPPSQDHSTANQIHILSRLASFLS